MPRDGDAPLARFVHAVVREVGFSLGPPRLSDAGSTVTVPILRTDARARRYVLAAEASDDLVAVDPGRIDRLGIRNESSLLVFLPPGCVFEGLGTASRGTTAGILLGPGAARDLEVRCVEPAKPIRPGKSLTLAARPAADALTQALMSGDQGLAWETASAISDEDPDEAAASSDPRECGRILLDAEGPVAAEICAHPDSWARLARRPTRGIARPNPLGLNLAHAHRVARAFLEGLLSTPFRSSMAGSWIAADASAGFTVVDGEVIHLLAFGRDLTHPATAGTQTPSPDEVQPVSSDADLESSLDGSGEADVAVASPSLVSLEEAVPTQMETRPRRRKVLTTGWDSATFASLERFSHKEFRGDRSAAIRALVRKGLHERGYVGPHALPPASALAPLEGVPAPSPPEPADLATETKVRDYQRIAATEGYAGWLRKRARLELEKLAAADDAFVQLSARTALDGLPAEPSEEPEEAPSEPEELGVARPETTPAPPPLDVRPLLRRAFAASAGGRYPEALTLFDEVLTAEPDNRTALLGRAVALRRSGKAQEALDALDAVLRAEPTNAAALLNRGRLLQERGDLSAALEAFELLASVAPNDWDVWLVRGDVLAKLGRRQEALQAYAEALRRNPDDENLKLRIRSLENAESAAAPPPTPQIPLPRDVQEGQAYLVREPRPSLSLRVLRALAARGVPSLVITPRSPDAVRRDVGITGIRILELSHTPGEGRHDPTGLAALGALVGRFVQEGHGHGVIALDGLGPLVLENGARDTLLFIEHVHEVVLQSHALLLVSAAPGELSEREMALLERSLRTLS